MNGRPHSIVVVGLGYVGLPLAVAFAKKYRVTGFDIKLERINELKLAHDSTGETNREDLQQALIITDDSGLRLTNRIEDIREGRIYIVTVPTPVDNNKLPDLSYLLRASETVGKVLKKNDIVVYESTVYPGCTEEDCVPVLEQMSGLKYNEDFFCAYSPERVNPGDKINTLVKIKKVTSGSTPEIADEIDQLYASIIEAGTYKAPSIKVAEASKAIENAQRDLNISFVNELALIFDRMNIDTSEVLEAAATKWNFLPFKPGLVGGHCISVDPYYLMYKAQSLGYNPQVILSGRNVNDSMGVFVAQKVIKLIRNKGIPINTARILILGITFKENCPDIRNTKIVDIYNELISFGASADIYDPWANKNEVEKGYGIKLLPDIDTEKDYTAIIVAVAHDSFKDFDFKKYKSKGSLIFDTKGMIDKSLTDARL